MPGKLAQMREEKSGAAASAGTQTGVPELTVVVPTYNESENVPAVYAGLQDALEGIHWEVIFVDDDSPDATSLAVRDLAKQDSRVRLLHRVGRRGLSSACIEGMLASTSPYMVVMDGDMQHDEAVVPTMLEVMKRDDCDLVVGSRNVGDGSFGGMPENRVKMSKFATRLTRIASKVELGDPMSGFFMIRRQTVDTVCRNLYGQGFKILLDICTNAPGELKIVEVPYAMRDRKVGESKLSLRVMSEFALFLVSKMVGRVIPVPMLKFFLVGLSGVLVHMTVLGMLYRVMTYPFLTAQMAAICVAIASNFVLNNRYTFRNRRLTGSAFWSGLASFYLVCAMGAVIGISVGEMLHNVPLAWWIAGLATTMIAALWNYSVSSILTWRTGSRARSS